MFEVTAKTSMEVYRLDFHMSDQMSYNALVYYRRGSLGNNDGVTDISKWTKMCDAVVTGNGKGRLTAVRDCTPVAVTTNENITIYATLEEPVMVIGSGSSGVVTAGDDLVVSTGKAVTYLIGDQYDAYAWNGRIHYTIGSSSASCEDKLGTVELDTFIGRRTCAWLSINLARFAYACEFVDVAALCPQTCGSCDAT